jgi:hypothetical protein
MVCSVWTSYKVGVNGPTQTRFEYASQPFV